MLFQKKRTTVVSELSQSQSSFIVNFFACQTYKGIDKNVSHSPTVKHIKCVVSVDQALKVI